MEFVPRTIAAPSTHGWRGNTKISRQRIFFLDAGAQQRSLLLFSPSFQRASVSVEVFWHTSWIFSNALTPHPLNTSLYRKTWTSI